MMNANLTFNFTSDTLPTPYEDVLCVDELGIFSVDYLSVAFTNEFTKQYVLWAALPYDEVVMVWLNEENENE